MWFKNLQIYRLQNFSEQSGEHLETQLSKKMLSPCGPMDFQRQGWVPANPEGALLHMAHRQWLIALGQEERLLPATIIRQHVDDRAKAIEETRGRKPGRKELRDLRERLTIELMPKAFVQRRTLFAWINPVENFLVIDTTSEKKSESLVEQLIKTDETIHLALLSTKFSPLSAMTRWVASQEAPAGFSIDQDIELRSNENASIRYTKHSLEGKEIREHISQGKSVTRLGMTWNDRISFILDDKGQLRRLSFLDILKEESELEAENEMEQFNLDFVLMTGELSKLLNDLIAALGGEIEEQSA